MTPPKPQPEADLIRTVRQAARIRAADAARAAGISKPWWSAIEQGYERRSGEERAVRPKADVIAHMAWAIGLDPGRLAEHRPDAIPILEEILRDRGQSPLARPRDERAELPALVRDHLDDAVVVQVWNRETMPEATRLGMIEEWLRRSGQLSPSSVDVIPADET